MAKKKWEEYKKSVNEMTEQLLQLPVAQGAESLFQESFLRKLCAYESTIHRLSGFINFLSKLNPMQYLDWMKEAFSKFVHEKTIPASPSAPQITHSQVEAATNYGSTDVAKNPTSTQSMR